MDYTVVGFPRIGEKRELKFAIEKYWRGELDETGLRGVVSGQRAAQWTRQQEAGESLIPSNDYSLYDGMLDTAFMLNAIPVRYEALGLSELDTYFAMARGYQGEKGDVKAFTMKKWFNTNYHYLVPELEKGMTLTLNADRFLEGFRQAKALGILTKPVVIGPFTFLKLSKLTGQDPVHIASVGSVEAARQEETCTACGCVASSAAGDGADKSDFIPALKSAYRELLKAAAAAGAEWIQIDEPCLVYDLTAEDIALFTDFYQDILADKAGIKVLLQTYFGDVRDCYRELIALPFDGIGLDFIEGRKTEELIAVNGFPKDKVLFAGLINGKNIWRSDAAKVLAMLRSLRDTGAKVVLTTSCSLLHVPYTVANEPQLDREVAQHFSFAYEKLEEMREICRLFELGDSAEADPVYVRNQRLFEHSDLRTHAGVQAAVAALKEEDFTRKVPRKERQERQRKLLGLPLLPTTTIGSFPQTKEVKSNRSRWRRGEISEEEYDENVRAFIRDCIALQEDIGLDVLVHGEFERNDMVEFFGENLEGFVFTKSAWVQSYGTRGVKPPIVFGDIRRRTSITTRWIAYAQSLTDKPVKGMLTGPVTILNWSFPREDISLKEQMFQIGLVIRKEVLELEAAGIRIIQIDEAALREKLPLRREDWNREYLDYAIPAFRLCHARVRPETQIHTHMCYSEFEDIIPAIDAMDADVITFEASRSKLTILDSLQENHFETEVGPGVYDIHSPRVPGVEEIKAALRIMLTKVPKENLWVNPDCGLKTRGPKETEASLRNLVQAAKEVRLE